jgi:nitroreductase
MDLMSAIRERRTIFRFDPSPVDDNVILRALDAARHAPNHHLTEPWGFIVVGPETKARLGEVARRLATLKAKDAKPEDLPALVERQVKKLVDVPCLIVATMKRTPENPMGEREDYAAVSCAIQNLQLSLWGDGVGCQWGTGGPTRDDETYRILGVDKATHEIVGFLKVGKPREVPPTTRKPVESFLKRLP